MRHNWVRYWHKLDENPTGLPTSYLPEVDHDDISRVVYREFQTLPDLEGIQCLILLGEPGIGKSAAIEDEVRRLQEANIQVEVHDLKAYGDPTHFERRIFESEKFKSLAVGENLVLFLDSLDEGRMVIENVGPMLFNELRKHLPSEYIKSRIKLRITCRSVEWPATLTAKLKELFGEKNVAVWHLCQLRRSDVHAAAADFHLDPDAFLKEIGVLNAEPLAIRPVTLRLLLRLKRKDGSLPNKQIDVYRYGLSLLCSETNDERREMGSERSTGRLDASHRLAIARRIAAMSMFCQRPFVALSIDDIPSDASVLRLSDICPIESAETDGGGSFEFSAADVQEVLRTGLFRRSASDRVSWSHQTYMEFLAAEYLVVHKFSSSQINALLTVDIDDVRIAPQLHETSSWLASLNSDFSRALLSSDPSVLLRSDLLAAESDLRELLASSYLKAIEARELNEDDLHQYYYRLSSPNLHRIVRPYICSPSIDPVVLRAALSIAHACEVQGLSKCLLEIALSTRQPFSLRRLAIRALKVAPSEEKQQLRPLLADPDDEVQANALKILWPAEISTEEMLRSIRPANDNMIGTYDSFIGTEVLSLLPDRDLPAALEWMASFIRRFPNPEEGASSANVREFHSIHKLLKGVYGRAVSSTDIASLVGAISAVVRALIENSAWLWELSGRSKEYRLVPGSDHIRRQIALQLIHELAGSGKAAVGLVWNLPYIVQLDFDWLLKVIIAEGDSVVRRLGVEIIFMIRDQQNYDQFEALYVAGELCPELKERRQQLSGYVELDSPMAKYLSAKETRRGTPRRGRQPETDDAIRSKVSRYIGDLEDEKYLSWWKLLRYAGWDVGSPTNTIFQSGLGSLSRWKYVNIRDERLSSYAIGYLRVANPKLEEWWPNNSVTYWPAWAGYRALDCLLDIDPEYLRNLPPETWAVWAPVVVGFRMTDEDRLGRGAKLAALCHMAVPEQFSRRVKEAWEFLADTGNGQINFRWHLKEVWDAALGEILADILERPNISRISLHDGLWLLLDKEHPRGVTLVSAAIRGETVGERRTTILWTALRHHHGRRWSEIWPVLTSDYDLGLSVLMAAAGDKFLEDMTALSADDMADLYLLLSDIPDEYADTPDGSMTPLRHLLWERDRIPRILAANATPNSLAALIRLKDTDPALSWISHYITECRDNIRRTTWTPLDPAVLLALSSDRAKTTVRSGRELLRLLTDSLRRYEAQLFASPPAISDLWNTVPGKYAPKSENEISDAIIRFMRNDIKGRGIVANREVEIRPAREGAPGSRSDIHVDAVAPEDSQDVIHAVIEVKGCWNDEVKTSMKDQLVGMYLTGTGINHGMYLVIWTVCPAWWNGDYRHRARRRLGQTIDEARSAIEEQSLRVSSAGTVVHAMVLDARWPGDGTKASATTAAKASRRKSTRKVRGSTAKGRK